MATIQETILMWKKALRIEANHLKSQGGSRLTIIDGELLSWQKQKASYWFMLASDVVLPTDTPILPIVHFKLRNDKTFQ